MKKQNEKKGFINGYIAGSPVKMKKKNEGECKICLSCANKIAEGDYCPECSNDPTPQPMDGDISLNTHTFLTVILLILIIAIIITEVAL